MQIYDPLIKLYRFVFKEKDVQCEFIDNVRFLFSQAFSGTQQSFVHSATPKLPILAPNLRQSAMIMISPAALYPPTGFQPTVSQASAAITALLILETVSPAQKGWGWVIF